MLSLFDLFNKAKTQPIPEWNSVGVAAWDRLVQEGLLNN
jgi:hypothetical protein